MPLSHKRRKEAKFGRENMIGKSVSLLLFILILLQSR